MKKPTDTAIITKQQFTTPSEFSQHIEKRSAETGVSHMECLIDFCARNDIDVEVVSKMVSKSLKAKIRLEAEDRNLLTKKGPARLL